jgi:selenide,water dikinase
VDFSVFGQVMSGGISMLNEAGVALLGCHSVRDDQVKFGYKQNSGAKPDNRVF